jgi:hypothetical protein
MRDVQGPYLGLGDQLLGQVQLVLLNQGGAHRLALGLEEGEDHAAAAAGSVQRPGSV